MLRPGAKALEKVLESWSLGSDRDGVSPGCKYPSTVPAILVGAHPLNISGTRLPRLSHRIMTLLTPPEAFMQGRSGSRPFGIATFYYSFILDSASLRSLLMSILAR
jgi:hypothetical protein